MSTLQALHQRGVLELHVDQHYSWLVGNGVHVPDTALHPKQYNPVRFVFGDEEHSKGIDTCKDFAYFDCENRQQGPHLNKN